jgi:hypothetical protein
VDGILAGYRWTIVNNHVTQTYFPHTDTDIHSISTELFKDFRNRNLFSIFIKGAYIISKNEGFQRCYSETNFWNKRAVKANLKINAHKIGVASIFIIFRNNVVIWHDMSSSKLKFK